MRRFVSVALATLLLGVGATNPLSTAAETLVVFILDSENLMKAKNRLQSNDPAVVPVFNKLIREADRALVSETLSVVQKELNPPSGNKHDYILRSVPARETTRMSDDLSSHSPPRTVLRVTSSLGKQRRSWSSLALTCNTRVPPERTSVSPWP